MYPTKSQQPWFSSNSDEDSDEDKCFLCLKSKQSNEPLNLFLSESNVHGLKYVGNPGHILGERFFWIIAVVIGVFFSVYLINFAVVEPLQASPVIMSFEGEEKTIDQIPFPAFTICNTNKLRQIPFIHLAGTIGNDSNAIYENPSLKSNRTLMKSIEMRVKALRLLLNHCSMSSSFSEFFENVTFQEKITQIGLDGAANESESHGLWRYTRNVYHHCDEMVVRCLWDNKVVDCKTVFFAIQTEFEHCCVFNMMPQTILRTTSNYRNDWAYKSMSNATMTVWKNWHRDTNMIYRKKVGNNHEKVIPKRQRRAGMTSGLSVLLNLEESQHWTQCRVQEGTGFRGQVHSIIDNPHVSEYGEAIEAKRETFMKVHAQVTIPDEDVTVLPLNQRQCYFFKDFQLSAFKFYTQYNCFDECLMNKTIDSCKCVRFYMPRTDKAHLCHTKAEFDCLKDLKKNLTNASMNRECPMCLPSCTQISYSADTDSMPLRDDVNLWATSDPNMNTSWANESLAIVHVFFSRETVESRARKSLYGIEEIVGNAGGLLGVTLGFSMLSLFEPIYFILAKLFCKRNKVESKNSLVPKVLKVAKRKQQPKHETKNIAKFSPTKMLVNPADFMRWSDEYLSDPGLRSRAKI